MRYLSMIFVVCVIVLLAGCDRDTPANTMNRSDADIAQVEAKLLNVKEGDLLVVITPGSKGLMDIDEVRNPPVDGHIMTVKEIHYHGIHERRLRDVLVSDYLDFHKSRGTVRIIPKERVEGFYNRILSNALMSSEE
jgi:hypothetical protein